MEDRTTTLNVPATTNALIMWAPPAMVNPVIINLATSGQDWWQFAPTQDVIFIGASGDRTSKLQTEGGHNIMVLGGSFKPSTDATGTLAFYGVTGSVYIDGVVINNINAHVGQDGIDIAGGGGNQPDLFIQNSLITNVTGSSTQGHADMVQTQGLVGNINIFNLTGDTNYQGLFFSPQYSSPPKGAHLSNINLSYNGQTTSNGSPYSYLLWTADTNNPTYPVTYDDVYVKPRDGQSAAEFAVWPKSSVGQMGAVQSGDKIWWPNLPYTGSVTAGTHTDFADPTKIGLNFTDTNLLIDAATHGTSLATGGDIRQTGWIISTSHGQSAAQAQPTTPTPAATTTMGIESIILHHNTLDHWN